MTDSDDDNEDKRKKFLERNRAAAMRVPQQTQAVDHGPGEEGWRTHQQQLLTHCKLRLQTLKGIV